MFDFELIAQRIMTSFQALREGLSVDKNENRIIPIVYGQTATGKTRLSLKLAKQFKEQYGLEIEVISADSRQVYKYMDIGTDKVGEKIRKKITHHMIDIIEPDQIVTAGEWQEKVYQIIPEILERGHLPVIVGWTGLYIDTLVYNFNMGVAEPDSDYREMLEKQEAISKEQETGSRQQETGSILWDMLNEVDPAEAAKHHPSSTRFIIRALEIYKQTWIRKSELMIKQGPKYHYLMIWLWQDPELGNKLIDKRLEVMINDGLVSEVQGLLKRGYNQNLNSMKSIDYKQTIEFLQKFQIQDLKFKTENWELKVDDEGLFKEYMDNLRIVNHQLAKKQRTWFRKYAREAEKTKTAGSRIEYLDFYLPDFALTSS